MDSLMLHDIESIKVTHTETPSASETGSRPYSVFHIYINKKNGTTLDVTCFSIDSRNELSIPDNLTLLKQRKPEGGD